MSYFKAKMLQILFRLGLCPRPCWMNSQRSPNPLAGFMGLTSKGRERRKDGREGQGRERGERGWEKREKGEELRIWEGKGTGLPSVPPVPNLPLYTTISQRETVRLQRGSVLAKSGRGFCRHCRSILNHCNLIGLRGYRIRWNIAK